MATEPDKVNTGALATIVVCGAFAMMGISFAVAALVRSEVAAEQVVDQQGSDSEIRDLRATQLAQLNAGPAWSDQKKGYVQLPIDRAAEAVIEALRQNPYAASPLPPKPDAGTEVSDAGAAPVDADGGALANDAGSDAGSETIVKDAPAPEAPKAPTPAEPKKPVPAAPKPPTLEDATPAPAPAPPTTPAPAPAAPAPEAPAP